MRSASTLDYDGQKWGYSKPTFVISSAEDTLLIGMAEANATDTQAPSPDKSHPLLRAV